jgi:hypothetical protein
MATCLGGDFVDEIRMIAVGSALHAIPPSTRSFQCAP